MDMKVIEQTTGSLVYLVEDDELLAANYKIRLEQAGYRVRYFSKIDKFIDAYGEDSPAAIIMDVMFESNQRAGLEAIESIKESHEDCPPVIFISGGTDVETRLSIARAGAYRFFSKPLDIKKLVWALDGLVEQNASDPFRVLLIDDDEEVLEYHSVVLRKAGMEVLALTRPLKAFEEMFDFMPDVVVTDIYMPGCTGPELAQMIRQDDDWSHTAIVFLSMEEDVDRQILTTNQVGDEFISKNIEARRFVDAITAKARQSRRTAWIHNEMESALRESEFQRITTNQHDIVSTADIAGRITAVNDKFCEVSGYSREELLGQNHRMLKSGKHPGSFYQDLWNTISSGKVWHGTICNKKKDGEEYWVESTIVPFLDENGRPYKYVSARTDITAHRLSEDRLNRSQEFANIGTWDWNIETGDLYWSDRIWPLFGYKKAVTETTYENFLGAVHEDDRQYVIDSVSNCVEKGEDYNIEHRVVWPDGTVRWMHESGDVTRDENGKALHMLGVVQDITARKITEGKLIESEEQNRLLLESAGEGIYGLDIDGRVTFVNPAVCEVFGYSAEEVIGQRMHDLVHHSYADGSAYPREKCPIYATRNDGLVHKSADEVFWHKDGSSIPVEYTSTPIRKSGKVVGAVVTFRDISERLKAKEALLQAKKEAEEANHAKSHFLSSMSHELRTPMNAIIGFSQLLTMETGSPLDESQLENVNEISRAGNHLLELINDVLDLAKIESGRIDLSIETVYLAEVITESLQLIMPLAQKRGIEIQLKLDGAEITVESMYDMGVAVRADNIRLRQAILNLLSNAVKYNVEQGSIVIDCVSTGACVNDGMIRICVSDTGAGLTEDEQAQLFRPFNRLGADQSEIEGTGIGLVITKNIIELMNGSIGAESQKGKGSTFWLEIPKVNNAQPVHKQEVEKMDSAREQSTNITEEQHSVLYIEDNPANLRLVAQLLGRLPNINMVSAHEPYLGLELAKEHKPDLILLMKRKA